MKFIDDAIKESEERMEKVDSKKTISSDIDEDLIGFIKKTNIFVVGAGGAGNNTISRLNEIGIEGAETITVNTDAQDLYYSQSDKKILLGRKTSGGLGAGGDPSIGEECAEETEDEIRESLEGKYSFKFIRVLLPAVLVVELVLVQPLLLLKLLKN